MCVLPVSFPMDLLFIMVVMNPPEKKPEKRTYVHCREPVANKGSNL